MTGKLGDITISDIIGTSSDDQEIHERGTQSLALNIVRQYPEGIAAKGVADFLKLSTDRTRSILEELVLRRDIYKRKVPGNKLYLYYPNGKLIHKYLQESQDIGDQIFRLSFHEGRKSPRLQIQERKFTLLEGEKVEGSIFIDLDNIQHLIEFINDIYIKFNQYNEESKWEH